MCRAPRTGGGLGRRRRTEEGTALVEFALILPLAVLILFGLIDFGFVFQGYNQMRNGVQAGARLASENNTSYSGATKCTGGPDSATMGLVCSILSSIGPLTGVSSTSLEVGIAFSAPPGDLNNPPSEDVTVCASGDLNSTSGLLAKPFLGEKMSSSSTILITSSPVYSAYNSSTSPVYYGGVQVQGENC
jgi:Flp pilus assembly protein TadG